MAQLVSAYQTLRSTRVQIPTTHVNKTGVLACVCYPSTQKGEGYRDRFPQGSLVRQAGQPDPIRDSNSKGKVEVNRHFWLHMHTCMCT